MPSVRCDLGLACRDLGCLAEVKGEKKSGEPGVLTWLCGEDEDEYESFLISHRRRDAAQ